MNVILAQEEKKKHKPKPKGINDRIDDTDKDNSVIYNKNTSNGSHRYHS